MHDGIIIRNVHETFLRVWGVVWGMNEQLKNLNNPRAKA